MAVKCGLWKWKMKWHSLCRDGNDNVVWDWMISCHLWNWDAGRGIEDVVTWLQGSRLRWCESRLKKECNWFAEKVWIYYELEVVKARADQDELVNHLFISVHIVAQQANWYIVAFHIAILYDIYLPWGSRSSDVDGTVGTLVYSEVTGHNVRSAMHPLVDGDFQAASNNRPCDNYRAWYRAISGCCKVADSMIAVAILPNRYEPYCLSVCHDLDIRFKIVRCCGILSAS